MYSLYFTVLGKNNSVVVSSLDEVICKAKEKKELGAHSFCLIHNATNSTVYVIDFKRMAIY